MSENIVLVEKDGPVAIVTMNRPDVVPTSSLKRVVLPVTEGTNRDDSIESSAVLVAAPEHLDLDPLRHLVVREMLLDHVHCETCVITLASEQSLVLDTTTKFQVPPLGIPVIAEHEARQLAATGTSGLEIVKKFLDMDKIFLPRGHFV